jgi:chromosomal replication initiator protein
MVTPELAGEALQDIATRQPKPASKTAELLETVADYFDLDVIELKGTKRDKRTILARQIAMYFMREQTDFSLSNIGRELGGRQAIIVSQAHKKISAELNSDKELNQKILEIQQKLADKSQ